MRCSGEDATVLSRASGSVLVGLSAPTPEATHGRASTPADGGDAPRRERCEGALCGVKKRTAQPRLLCIVEVGRLVELALCGRVEA